MLSAHPVRRKPYLRILIYGLNYSPELTGIGKYTGEMAAWLAAAATMFASSPRRPTIPPGASATTTAATLYRTERMPGQPLVYRTPLYVPERPTGLKRIAHLFSFMLGSLPVMLRRDASASPTSSSPSNPPSSARPSRSSSPVPPASPAWLHVQDFEVDAAFDLGLLPAEGVHPRSRPPP